MDIKTLEYMEDRTKRARKIFEKIQSLKDIVTVIETQCEKNSGLYVKLSDKEGYYDRTGTEISHRNLIGVLNDKIAYSIFKQPIIDGLNAEIAKLEKELAEI